MCIFGIVDLPQKALHLAERRRESIKNYQYQLLIMVKRTSTRTCQTLLILLVRNKIESTLLHALHAYNAT